MSKGAVSVVAGYWPEDVYRYLQVPGLALDEALATRPARHRGDHPAVAAGGETLTYAGLVAAADAASQRLRGALGEGRRVAVAVERPLELLPLLLGALKAGFAVFPVDPGTPAEDLGRQLGRFDPSLVVADPGPAAEAARAVAGASWRVTSPEELRALEPAAPASRQRLDLKGPSVALAGADHRLVHHSHASLLAWAVSWSAFVPLTEESAVLCLEPLHGWTGLFSALAVLFRGGTCRIETPRALAVPAGLARALPEGLPEGGAWGTASFTTAAALASAGTRELRAAIGERLSGLFVTVERPFAVRARRAIEAALGVPVLTVLGTAATGPVVAAHPTWYLPEAAGIPLTNVDLWPLDPQTGEALAVPWEAIEFGEIGVQSPMIAVAHESPEDRARAIGGEWLRMGIVGTMDPNGLYYLQR